MVPDGWKRTTIKDALEKVIDYRGKAPPKSDTGVRLITARNIRFGKLDLSHEEFIETDLYESWMNRGRPRDSDVLFTTEAPLGHACMFPKEGRYAVGQRAITLRPKRGVLDSNYFLNYLLSPIGQNEIFRRSSGSTATGVKSKEFVRISLALPPIEEQRSIGKILSTWDRAIETTEKLIANSQTQKKALMQQLLTGKRRFSEHVSSQEIRQTRFGPIPEDWQILPIGSIAEEISNRNSDGLDVPVLSCTKYVGFVSSLEYFKKKVFSDDTSNYKLIRRGQFGFPSNHVEEGSIGLQDVVDIGQVSPIYCVFEANEHVHNGFLIKLFKTEHYRQIFAASTNASVDRRGSLRWKEFAKIRIALPSLSEQQKITAAIDSITANENALLCKLSAFQREKTSLMQQLLTGKRRVKVKEAANT